MVCGYNLSSINFLSLHSHFLPSNFPATPRSYFECSVSLWSLGSLSRGHGTEVLVGKLILLLPTCRHPQAAVSAHLISAPFRGAAHSSSGFKQSAWLRLLSSQVLWLPIIDHAGRYWLHTIHVIQHFYQKYTVMNFSTFPFIWLIFTWVLDMPLKIYTYCWSLKLSFFLQKNVFLKLMFYFLDNLSFKWHEVQNWVERSWKYVCLIHLLCFCKNVIFVLCTSLQRIIGHL